MEWRWAFFNGDVLIAFRLGSIALKHVYELITIFV